MANTLYMLLVTISALLLLTSFFKQNIKEKLFAFFVLYFFISLISFNSVINLFFVIINAIVFFSILIKHCEDVE